MKTEVKNITPELARELLSSNTNNRNCNDSHVRFLSSEMIKGNWVFDGQPIRISSTNQLLDGQHRLTAIVKSNTIQKFLILHGIDDQAFKVMDTGKNRSASDSLHVNGVINASEVAACARMIINHKLGRTSLESGTSKISNTDVIDWYSNNRHIQEHIKKSKRLYPLFSLILPKSYIGSFSYLFSEINASQSDDFLNKLCTGLDLEINSPIFLLRKKLTEDKMSTSKLSPTHKRALIIKAWNVFRLGKSAKLLRWNKENESFPIIL
jgi:hypothetical protein